MMHLQPGGLYEYLLGPHDAPVSHLNLVISFRIWGFGSFEVVYLNSAGLCCRAYMSLVSLKRFKLLNSPEGTHDR